MSRNQALEYLPGKRRIALEHDLQARTLRIQVRFTRDLRRYFRGNSFSLRYSDELHAEDELLAIPGLALLLPLAWVAGADISVARLDRTFADAVSSLREGYHSRYPGLPFSTRLEVGELVDSPPLPEGTAMMFSGGLDATYTFFANRHLNPHLVQVFGTEFPCSERRFMDMMKRESSAFAEKHGALISYVETDYRSCVDERALYHAFAKGSGRLQCTLWNGLGFALGFLGIAAPLSAGRFNHLMLAAWASADRAYDLKDFPHASSPIYDEMIAWANLRVEHHGCLHRYEKVREMKGWLDGHLLRVCWRFDDPSQAEGTMNCSQCEKCSRTMLAIAVAGMDPARYGFTVDEETKRALRARLESRQTSHEHLEMWWQPMQKEIPEQIEGDCYGMRDILEWYRDFDLLSGPDPKPPPLSLHRLYCQVPYPLALAIRSAVYAIRGEPHWMNRPERLPPEPDQDPGKG